MHIGVVVVIVLYIIGTQSSTIFLRQTSKLRHALCDESKISASPVSIDTWVTRDPYCTDANIPILLAEAKRCIGYMIIDYSQRMEEYYDRHPRNYRLAWELIFNHYETWGDEEMHWEMPCVFKEAADRDAFRAKLAAELEAGSSQLHIGEPPEPPKPLVVNEGDETPWTSTVYIIDRPPDYYLVWRDDGKRLSLARSRVVAAVEWHSGDANDLKALYKGPVLTFSMPDMPDRDGVVNTTHPPMVVMAFLV